MSMRIIRLQAENIKRLIAVDITPNSDLIKITGKNGAGKTSVLDCLFWLLAGKRAIQEKPIRDGETKGRIVADIGKYVVTRTFTESGGSLLMRGSTGEKIDRPQEVLDSIVGAMSFDVLKFVRMSPKEQFNELRKIVPMEIDIDDMDQKRAAYYELRTKSNDRMKSKKAQHDAIVIPDDCPTEPRRLSELLEELHKAKDHNTSLEEEMSRSVHLESLIEDCKSRIEKLVREIDDHEKELLNIKTYLSDKEKIDCAEIEGRISGAEEHNEMVKLLHQKKSLKTDWLAASEHSDELTSKIESIDLAKMDAMSKAAFPVVGLSFGSECVMFNGIPLSQTSASEQLRVSLGIAMAANPELRVIRITDGSLLDSDSMKIVEEMAAENDFQVWIEVVDESGNVGIVVEDGRAKG